MQYLIPDPESAKPIPHSALGGALKPISPDSIWYQAKDGDELELEVSEEVRDRLLALGLEEDFIAPVVHLERFVSGWSFDLCDPMTLSRFLLGKPDNLADAKQRLTESCEWRANAGLDRILREYGVATIGPADMPVWAWKPQSERARTLAPHFFGHCISARTQGGGPVLVLQLGAFDLEGAVREDLVDDLLDPWIFLVEQTFQLCRAISASTRRLVKLSAIVDVDGVNLSWIPHMSLLQKFAVAINRNYPEMAATLTIVRAPLVFSWLWQLSAPLLLEEMTRQKFAILGHDFAKGLAEHAKVNLDELPEFLGGRASEAPRPTEIYDGFRRDLPQKSAEALSLTGNHQGLTSTKVAAGASNSPGCWQRLLCRSPCGCLGSGTH
mmetsp:Transcript_33442/g.77045  ORF Transcript_33442/g.77045 Transcript_33442/m.77045 type:complete len:382 (-) Transcript_33442:18-1163(-)